MSDARGWGLLALVGVRFDGVDARFDAMNSRRDNLDRDVQGLVRDRFRRDD